jgi:pimeloyl-ACP methyl ester carboxylesterase
VAGNAEDALTEDLVAYIDATYRTIPEVSARGLSGFSMGGSGTINAGLRHPDVYAAIYAFSPGLLAEEGGLEGFLASNGAWQAYGAAFSPDPAAPFPHQVTINRSVPLAEQDPAVVAAWESGFGNLRAKVADYQALPDKLTAIRISYGTGDSYPWIPEGSEFLLGVFEENGIAATSHVFDGGHALDSATFAEDYVSYFSENLAG